MKSMDTLSRAGDIVMMLAFLALCPAVGASAPALSNGGSSVELRQVVRFRSTQGTDVAVYLFSDGGILVRRAESVLRKPEPHTKAVQEGTDAKPDTASSKQPPVPVAPQEEEALQEASRLAALVTEGVSLSGSEAVQALAVLGLTLEADASGSFTIQSLAPGAALHSQESFAYDAKAQGAQSRAEEALLQDAQESGESSPGGGRADMGMAAGTGMATEQRGEGGSGFSVLPSPSGSASWGGFEPAFMPGEESFAGDALNGKPISR